MFGYTVVRHQELPRCQLTCLDSPTGAMSDMPAVYSFSLYAALALLLNFILQMTCFVALLTLDAYRMQVYTLLTLQDPGDLFRGSQVLRSQNLMCNAHIF